MLFFLTGDEIIDFSKIKFLAMDWLSDPNRKVYASIDMKKIVSLMKTIMKFDKVKKVLLYAHEN